MDGKLYTLLDHESVAHLFRVASGMDSMVLGESEILGQVKQAYHQATKACTTGKVMHTLFQKSFQTAKAIRHKTGIGRGYASVSSVAVNMAKRILGSLVERRVMVLGAGEMSQLTVKVLREEGVSAILVSNRSYDRAKELASSFGGIAVHFEDFPRFIHEVDIIISSTSAPHMILTKETVSHWMKERKQRPLFLLDIAVPRDIDPKVNELDNVYLYNIDDLQSIITQTLSYRENQLTLCHSLVDQKVAWFMSWFHQTQSSE
jgi:glutamyl-tRNA reductase